MRGHAHHGRSIDPFFRLLPRGDPQNLTGRHHVAVNRGGSRGYQRRPGPCYHHFRLHPGRETVQDHWKAECKQM